LKNFIKKIFPFLYQTRWAVQPEHQVVKAFTSDGVDYYKFETGYNAYYERYMACMDRINEIEQRVDAKYLDSYQKMLDEYLRKGDLVNASILNNNLRERRQYIFNVKLLYNLASVWFFDKTENCYTYDYEYADKKIARWMKDKELLAFFLQTELAKFMPLPDTVKENLEIYLKGQGLKDLSSLKYHLSQLSDNPKNKELILSIQLQVSELEEYQRQILELSPLESTTSL